MLIKLLRKIFPSKNEKDLKALIPIVNRINEIYSTLNTLTDAELRAKTDEFKARIKERTKHIEDKINELKVRVREDKELTREERLEIYDEMEKLEKELFREEQKVLDEILPEAYAVVKETCRRLVGKSWEVTGHKIVWDMVPFDVQLMGAVVLHQGKIAEMATGEGKTLVATMPAFLNALTGRGVHIVTVNDYLALRDSQWMGKIYEFLGLTVGCIQNWMNTEQRKAQYNCDITYGTNNEFGFDYLRDNMAPFKFQK